MKKTQCSGSTAAMWALAATTALTVPVSAWAQTRPGRMPRMPASASTAANDTPPPPQTVPNAHEPAVSTPRPRQSAFGLQLDLFPTVASAFAGQFGIAPQVWVGIDRVRMRVVAARVRLPDALAFTQDGFTAASTTAAAFIIDYTFGEKFDEWWVGAGVEYWAQTIQNERVKLADGSNAEAAWDSVVFTVGGGYTWRFAGNWYLDPWVGVHAVLNPKTITIGSFEHKPFPLQAEASLKIGYFFDL